MDPESGLIRNAKAPDNATVAVRWLGGEAYFDGEMPSVQGIAARDFAILDALAPDHKYDETAAALLSHAPVSVGGAFDARNGRAARSPAGFTARRWWWSTAHPPMA